LAARDGQVMIISQVGIDMEGLRKEEDKKGDKLEVREHDSRSDSGQGLDCLSVIREAKCVFQLLRNWDSEPLDFMHFGMALVGRLRRTLEENDRLDRSIPDFF
jgi:hypothetical protein